MEIDVFVKSFRAYLSATYNTMGNTFRLFPTIAFVNKSFAFRAQKSFTLIVRRIRSEVALNGNVHILSKEGAKLSTAEIFVRSGFPFGWIFLSR